ncbi:hypothetical protein [Nostoc sp. LEGE 12447]|nr:hypothetical protein [Nostoc sp. LEGE 12447]
MNEDLRRKFLLTVEKDVKSDRNHRTVKVRAGLANQLLLKSTIDL